MNENIKKILMIEDDVHIAKIFEIQLKKAGFIVTVAHDGEEATKIIATNPPDLFILDLMIPKKDGFSVLEEIKKNPIFTKTPVLVVSNLGQKSDEARVRELGAAEYFVKIDNSIEEIINKVKLYLQ